MENANNSSSLQNERILENIKTFLRRKPFGMITRSRVHVEPGHIFNTYYYISENEETIFKARRCLTNNSIMILDCNDNLICKLKTNMYGTKYILGDIPLFIKKYIEDENINSDQREIIENDIMEWPLISDLEDTDKLLEEEIRLEDDELEDDQKDFENTATVRDVNNTAVNNIKSQSISSNNSTEYIYENEQKINLTMADCLNYKHIEKYLDNKPVTDNSIIRSLEIIYDTTQKDQGKPRSLKIKINELTLINKKPYFNIETSSYSLNFSGRVTRPSAKNFQVIHPLDPTYITLTFGKENQNSYILDFSYPWTALHAFCVGLSALDHKYGND